MRYLAIGSAAVIREQEQMFLDLARKEKALFNQRCFSQLVAFTAIGIPEGYEPTVSYGPVGFGYTNADLVLQKVATKRDRFFQESALSIPFVGF
jgi:hypothetical protein